MDAVLFTLGSVLAVSLVPLVGILFLALHEDALRRAILPIVSFSTGSMLGTVFLHMVPAMAEQQEELSRGLAILLGGVVFSFAVEKVIHWRHCHVLPREALEHEHYHPAGLLSFVGDGIHNFVDGAVIAASFLVSVPLGFSATLAVIFHEIPQEIGDFAVLVHSGFTRRRALLFNLLSGVVAFLGAGLVLLGASQWSNLAGGLLPFAAGNFLYIAGSDLIPELHKEARLPQALGQILAMVAGILVMALLGVLK